MYFLGPKVKNPICDGTPMDPTSVKTNFIGIKFQPKFVEFSKVEEVGLHEDDRFKFLDMIEIESTGEVMLIGTEPGYESNLLCIRNVTGT